MTNRENFRIYTWNGSNNDNVAAKTLPFKPVSQIIDIDCMNVSHQNVGDQRKRSSEIFAVGLSDGPLHLKLYVWFLHAYILINRKVFHHSQIRTNRESD